MGRSVLSTKVISMVSWPWSSWSWSLVIMVMLWFANMNIKSAKMLTKSKNYLIFQWFYSGESITLACEAGGSPPPTVTWWRGHSLVRFDYKLIIINIFIVGPSLVGFYDQYFPPTKFPQQFSTKHFPPKPIFHLSTHSLNS